MYAGLPCAQETISLNWMTEGTLAHCQNFTHKQEIDWLTSAGTLQIVAILVCIQSFMRPLVQLKTT
uniref:Uncharacterized protein n=1 Tax=Anguilla anguilla TaxID=7936 RepID=A0A0E9PF08_ANGAN